MALAAMIFVAYLVLVVPVLWLIYGSDMGKVQDRKIAAIAKYVAAPFGMSTHNPGKVNQNGYRQLFGQ